MCIYVCFLAIFKACFCSSPLQYLAYSRSWVYIYISARHMPAIYDVALLKCQLITDWLKETSPYSYSTLDEIRKTHHWSIKSSGRLKFSTNGILTNFSRYWEIRRFEQPLKITVLHICRAIFQVFLCVNLHIVSYNDPLQQSLPFPIYPGRNGGSEKQWLVKPSVFYSPVFFPYNIVPVLVNWHSV